MKYIKGFLMAWGCFCRIPCPYRGWDEDNRYAMLNMFPLIGTAIGIVVSVAWLLLSLLGTGALLTGALLTFCYFWLTGFIHLDGFMDCSDAVLSRRSPEERQRILKDSRVGAFAVISFCFMLLIFFVSMVSLTESFSLTKAAALCAVFTVSRELSAYNVINRTPMQTSQYLKLSSCSGRKRGLPGLVVTAIICLISVLLPAGGLICGNTCVIPVVLLCILLVQILLGSLVGRNMRKQLGGMSGDISGCMIVTGELTGILLLALASGMTAL